MNDIFTSLRRTPYQTTAAFSVLFFTLLLSGLMFVILSFMHGLLQYVETRPRIIIYFQIKATEEEISRAKEVITRSDKASNVKYISKSDAYKIYKEFTKNDPILLEMTSPDILPASLEIDAKEPAFLTEIASLAKDLPGVDEVQYQRDIVQNLLNLTSIVRRVVVAFFTYLLCMSIIVLATTISFKIALKKDEILLLRLLGATSWFIRKPFIDESVFLGLSATIASGIFLSGLLFSINRWLQVFLTGVPELSLRLGAFSIAVWPFNVQFAILTVLVIAFFSLVIALTASFAATKRYL